MTLDIIINVYNNEKNILNLFNKLEEELKSISHTYIFVDDASSDKTLNELKNIQKKNDANIKIIELAKTQGKDASIYAGLNSSTSDLVCIYDTTLQANASYITKMYDILKKNKAYDQICMLSNFNDKKTINSKIKLLNLLYGIKINNNKTYYRLMRKNVVNKILELSYSYPFTQYIFELLDNKTNYIKFDNSNIDNNKLSRYIVYSKRIFELLKTVNYIFITIFILLLLSSIFKIFRINNIVLLVLAILCSIINILLLNYTFKYYKKEKTYYSVKETIGFDDNLL